MKLHKFKIRCHFRIISLKKRGESCFTILCDLIQGGGDSAEDVHGGLKAAADLDWASATRILYLIGDAPCHGRKYHNVNDDYPDGHPSDVPAATLLNTLRAKNVIFFFGKITQTR